MAPERCSPGPPNRRFGWPHSQFAVLAAFGRLPVAAFDGSALDFVDDHGLGGSTSFAEPKLIGVIVTVVSAHETSSVNEDSRNRD